MIVIVLLINHDYTPCSKVWGVTILESGCLSVHLSCLVQKISSKITKLYASKLGMMVHHHDSGCYAKRLGSYLQLQGHSAGSNPQKITVSSISPELLNLIQIWYSGASS